jgi:MoxR-like ATPase
MKAVVVIPGVLSDDLQWKTKAYYPSKPTENSAPMRLPELDAILADINRIILGKDRPVRLSLACLLARGHLLIEDVPGVGKTMLAHVLARVLGMDFQRIQLTSDMLPADIIGVSIFDRNSGAFHFHPGPVFSQVVLADEINRATPKAQSALLEAMEERQVTAEGQTRPLPEPFFVIATQNPTHQVGTFPLPESQLDRFLLKIELGYPDPVAERELLAGADRRQMLASLVPRITPRQLIELQERTRAVHASPALIDYVQALATHTRTQPHWQAGLSPRACLALLAAARAWALLEGRDHVLPEDVQAVLPGVIAHRLRLTDETMRSDLEAAASALIEAVPLP